MSEDFDSARFESLIGQLLRDASFRDEFEQQFGSHGSSVADAILTEKKLSPDDAGQAYDVAFDLFRSNAGAVLSLGWDGNAPGMSGAIWISELGGIYIVTSRDYDDQGPFGSLDEAINQSDQFGVVTANPELDSDVLTLQRLKKLARQVVDWENDGDIWINSAVFIWPFAVFPTRADYGTDIANRLALTQGLKK
jgi:hypothetical protein